MLEKRVITTVVALGVLIVSWAAVVQVASAESRDELADRYTRLAGSEEDAKRLVSGLRSGDDFTLSGTRFRTPTGKMGNGEVKIALSLAEARLKEQGISKPTAAQLEAALVGDARHPGILALRAEGKGWGQIANGMGIRLGELMRSERAERHDKHERHEHVVRHERHERIVRHERPEKPERPERPERHGR